MNRKQLELVLGFLTMSFSFFSWWSVEQAIIMPNSSTWGVPIMFFSLYIVLLCLDMLLFQNILSLELLLLGTFVTSIFFAFSFLQVGAVLVGGYFIFLSSRKIREDMELNLRISPWKSLQAGKSYFLIAFALLITMQYFLTIDNFKGEIKAPYFDASFITKKVAIPFLSTVDSQFKVLRDETLTVDQFILQSQENYVQNNDFSLEAEQMIEAQLPDDLTQIQKDELKKQAMESFYGAKSQLSQKNQELILSSGRKQLSDMVGVPITGDEKIADIFTGLMSNKINNYFNTKIEGGEKNSTFSLILALVLFLIIFPLGSIFSVGWFLIAKLVFSLLLRFNVVRIRRVTVLKEILE